jgi:hypothetical protein
VRRGDADAGPALFQSGVNRGEQPPDPVRHPSGFSCQIVVEADENFQLSQRLIARIDPPQRVRQSASGISDDERVTGVGLGITRMDTGPPLFLLRDAEDTRFELVRACTQHAFQFCASAFTAGRQGP